ncbi:unnamed protein product [Onchocerca ochengi]|uniref:CUB domain-containing protein n=1 Tax=Onchocerca ochengi TaxID=42157 RepID=A0A182ETC0_ONCOC|nr:unnamed protein product [Onchocerca ochengi]
MRLSLTAVFFFTFRYILSAKFWTDVKLERLQWLNDCDLRDVCIHPTLQLRLFNIFNNETIYKTLKVDFDDQTDGTHLISYWNEGTPDTIVSTITLDGIDPDYDFPRLCDSTATIFLFRMNETKNITEVSGVCFKAQLTFTKYFDHCSYGIDSKTDQTNEKTWPTFLAVTIGCLITCLVLITIFVTINYILKVGRKSHIQIKRTSMSKTSMSNIAPLNAATNPQEFARSQVFPINIGSANLNLMKSPAELITREDILSANSSFCSSIAQY